MHGKAIGNTRKLDDWDTGQRAFYFLIYSLLHLLYFIVGSRRVFLLLLFCFVFLSILFGQRFRLFKRSVKPPLLTMWVEIQCNKKKMVPGPKLSALWILKCAFKAELICENDVKLQIIWLRLRKIKQEMNDASSKDFMLYAKKGRLKLKRIWFV